jgi:hypothetical protein
MQLDSQGLQAQEAAETARREAGKLGMKVLQQQMQVKRVCRDHPGGFKGDCNSPCMGERSVHGACTPKRHHSSPGQQAESAKRL